MKHRASTTLLTLVVCVAPALAQKKHAPIREDIPYGLQLNPRMEEPVFAVCSKQGMRILVSRDDGRTWKQTFLGTDSLEDGVKWETVFTAPKENVSWDTAFAVYEKVNAVPEK